MMGGGVLCSMAAAGSVRSAVGIVLISRLLNAERPGKKSVAVAAAGSAVLSLLLFAAGVPDVYRILSETALLAACAWYFQGAAIRMSLFIAVFYEIAVSFWQFLVSAWLGVLLSSPAFFDCGTGRGQMALWLLHLLLLFLAGYLLKHGRRTGREAFRFASLIVIGGFLGVITLSEQRVLAIADDTLDMWTVLAVVLMMAVLVFNMNRQYEVEKELAKVKAEQAKLLERDYTALCKVYERNAKLFHDLHNHIGVLRQLLSHGKADEAVRYLDELQLPVREMADAVWTGEEAVDYLINRKTAEAKENGTKYRIQVEFPRHTNVKSADLCAIVGNLLDNALEAAKQIPAPEERFVCLTIRRINQMLVIKVENSFARAPVEEGGALKTIKEENGLHGWGLRSARTAAEKYDGTVQTSYTGNRFRAVATLSYQGVPVK